MLTSIHLGDEWYGSDKWCEPGNLSRCALSWVRLSGRRAFNCRQLLIEGPGHQTAIIYSNKTVNSFLMTSFFSFYGIIKPFTGWHFYFVLKIKRKGIIKIISTKNLLTAGIFFISIYSYSLKKISKIINSSK